MKKASLTSEETGLPFSEAYAAFWKHPMPARAMIGVKDLPLKADIEMVATAVRPD